MIRPLILTVTLPLFMLAGVQLGAWICLTF